MAYKKASRFQRVALPHHVSESVNSIMGYYRKQPGFQICLLKMRWTEIVGQEDAKYLQPTKWFNGILTIKPSTSCTKFMLTYKKIDIMRAINQHFGNDAVKFIKYDHQYAEK